MLYGFGDVRTPLPQTVQLMEDMVVDYALERLGRYRATPFTSPRGPIGRMTLSLLTRAGG